MTALRKPDYLTGGHKMAYLASLLPVLTGDQFKLGFALVNHLSLRGCFPALDTLAGEMAWTMSKVRRVRDQLAEMGLIGFISGTGHKSTRYFIPGLAEHTAEMKGEKAPRVPKSPPEGVAQTDTEPSNPIPNRKEEGRVLKMVPTTGWQALKALADETTRIHWLDKLEPLGTGDDGVMVFSTDNPAIADRLRQRFADPSDLGRLARSVGLDPAKIAIRSAKHGVDPFADGLRTVPVTPRGGEEMANHLEEKTDVRPEPMPTPLPPNATSLAAYRVRKTLETDDYLDT